LSPIAAVDPESQSQLLPEAVEDAYFGGGENPSPVARSEKIVGVFNAHRPGVRNMIEQTLARLQRTRNDVRFEIFAKPPTPDDLRGVDVWVDPATSDVDFDGYVAEAIAAGKALVASRTPINSLRVEHGRTAFLIPQRDANELTHAILTALFKSEVVRLKIEAARQTAGKFRPRQRLRVLERIYETLVQ
jgi:glycosyltransferase involved in cell wall biosynthesis